MQSLIGPGVHLKQMLNNPILFNGGFTQGKMHKSVNTSIGIFSFWRNSKNFEAYSEPCRRSKMEFFATIVQGFLFFLWNIVSNVISRKYCHKSNKFFKIDSENFFTQSYVVRAIDTEGSCARCLQFFFW